MRTLEDMPARFLENKERTTYIIDETPAGRIGEPEDLAGAAVFLASPASDFVSGTFINVDGGLKAGDKALHHMSQEP